MVYSSMVESAYAKGDEPGHQDKCFPSFDYAEDEEPTRRRCMSFGEAASTFSWPTSAVNTADFFKIFYNGFTNDAMIWFAYEVAEDFELPAFRFSAVCTDSAPILQCIVSPGVLLVDFC